MNGKKYSSNNSATDSITFPGNQSNGEGRISFENKNFQTISEDPELLLLIGGKTPNNDYLNNIELLGKNDCPKIPM